MKKRIFILALFLIGMISSGYAQEKELGNFEDFNDFNKDGVLSLDEIKMRLLKLDVSEGSVSSDNNTSATKGISSVYWTKFDGGFLPGTENHAMAYDSERKTSVLFGGHNFDSNGTENYLDRTFVLLSDRWSEIMTSPHPSARQDHAMAFDKKRKKMVLFGGRKGLTYYNDTWEFDGASWIQVVTPSAPSPRGNFMMAYCPQIEKVILFGGRLVTSSMSFGTCYNDTWVYDGTSWTKLNPVNKPTARAYPMGDADTTFNYVLLYGGIYSTTLGGISIINQVSDTWKFDGTNWNYQGILQAHPTYQFDDLRYDPKRKAFIGFGCSVYPGNYGNNETWEYVANTWYKRSALNSPEIRLNSRLCYSETPSGVVLHGGFSLVGSDPVYFNDTFTVSGPAYNAQSLWTFESNQENWDFFTIVPSMLSGAYETGHLSFSYSGVDFFGIWASPQLPVETSRMYRARYYISTDITDPSKFPVLRFRANSMDGSFAAYTSITSIGNGELSPTAGNISSYDLYFVPTDTCVTNGMGFAVDIIHYDSNDAPSGKINLEEVEIESNDVPSFGK